MLACFAETWANGVGLVIIGVGMMVILIAIIWPR